MKDLIELLENNFEKIDTNIYAEWLSDEQTEPTTTKGMLKKLHWLDEECKTLLTDNRVKLTIDDRALIVNILNL
tara:strand:+ start:122 stop:343 length:222 start_codon:yes stop_codon:yes gene_type:complete